MRKVALHPVPSWVVLLALGSVLGAAPPDSAAEKPAKKDAAGSLDTDPHLVGWWKCDETSGKTAADSSGKGHPGTLEGGLSFDANSAPGRAGKAIQLGGRAGAVRVTGYKGVTGSGPRTAAAWIKTPAAVGQIVTWGLNDHGKMFNFGFVRGRIGLTPKGGYLYTRAALDDDQWHHVAVVVEEASPPNLHDNVKLYADGELAVIDDIGLLDLWPIETGDQLEVTVGRGMKGLLSDVRIYDRALSEDEIAALFKRPADAPKP